jgi:hypothetical protein
VLDEAAICLPPFPRAPLLLRDLPPLLPLAGLLLAVGVCTAVAVEISVGSTDVSSAAVVKETQSLNGPRPDWV